MKKTTITALFLALLLSITTPSFCEAIKIITLNDESVVVGTILKLENSVYTVETNNLGVITLNDADIVNISNAALKNNLSEQTTQPVDLKSKVTAMKGDILNDPAMIEEIKNLMNDPSIIQAMSDPNFISTIMSYDEEKIANDAQTQKLMRNPRIKALMQKMSGKLK